METRVTSHVTRHASHVTRHTSHVTRHTSHVRSFVHMGHVIFRSPRPGFDSRQNKTPGCCSPASAGQPFNRSNPNRNPATNTNCSPQITMPGGVLVHTASCGLTFTLVLAKPSSKSSSAAAAAASKASRGQTSPGSTADELKKGGDTKSDRHRSGRWHPVITTDIMF